MFNNFVKGALAPLVLRLGLAAVFIYHGSELVRKDFGTNWMPPDPPMPAAAQAAAAWGQLLGGVAMLLGILPRLAALGLIVIMAGAIALVHAPNGFNIQNQGMGWEYDFVLIVVCVAVILLGGGPIGLGRWLGFRRRPRV